MLYCVFAYPSINSISHFLFLSFSCVCIFNFIECILFTQNNLKKTIRKTKKNYVSSFIFYFVHICRVEQNWTMNMTIRIFSHMKFQQQQQKKIINLKKMEKMTKSECVIQFGQSIWKIAYHKIHLYFEIIGTHAYEYAGTYSMCVNV